MKVTEYGVPVEELIQTVKRSIKKANLSTLDSDRDLRVTAVKLSLNVIVSGSAGAGLDFRIPFLGMKVKLGAKVSKKDTHTIDITLVPPDERDRPELRDDDFESVFVDAVETVRATIAAAAGGDDPFVLGECTVEIAFAITNEGTVLLGVDGSLSEELTHSLILTLGTA
jgi:hypothetical protein